MVGRGRCLGFALAMFGLFCLFVEMGHRAPAGEKGSPPAKDEILIVGPFTFAQVCEKSEGYEDGGGFLAVCAKKTGLSEAEIRKSLESCKLWVIDNKKKTADGSEFGDDAKLVVEGKFAFELKNKEGKDFRIQLEACEFHGGRTDNSVSPATRDGIFQCQISAKGAWEIGRGYLATRICYDINAKTSGLQKDKDK
jgi:hypothetical protein